MDRQRPPAMAADVYVENRQLAAGRDPVQCPAAVGDDFLKTLIRRYVVETWPPLHALAAMRAAWSILVEVRGSDLTHSFAGRLVCGELVESGSEQFLGSASGSWCPQLRIDDAPAGQGIEVRCAVEGVPDHHGS